MATPAQIANDMEAQAKYWHRRDDEFARVCTDAAHVLRALINKECIDDRTMHGLHKRLSTLEAKAARNLYGQIEVSLRRAHSALVELSGWELRQ